MNNITKHCEKCNRTQSKGNYCLDCGAELIEPEQKQSKYKAIKTTRSPDTLKADIRTWLTRIGVSNPDIQIYSKFDEAQVDYILNDQQYSFKCDTQNNPASNLAGIESFLHSRVLSIERGIETTEKAFAGYEQLPDYSKGQKMDPWQALGFTGKSNLEAARNKFKVLAKKIHPDINDSQEAANQFRQIKEALDKIEKEFE